MPRALSLAAAIAVLARPPAAATSLDLSVSSSPAARRQSPTFRLQFQDGSGPPGRPAVGIGMRLPEGKPLEVLMWGSGGAVAGSLAGPLGAAVGSAVGAIIGLILGSRAAPRASTLRHSANSPEHP